MSIRGRLGTVPTSRWVTLAALTMVVTQLVIRGAWVSQSWFLVDDFLFLQDIALGKDNWEWYTRIHQGHFMPLSFALVKVASLFGAFNWTAVAIQIIALQAAASMMCWWMLRTVFGRSRAVLPLLAFYLFAPLTIPSIMWWAVAINQLPQQVALMGAVGMHVKYLRSGRLSYVAATTAFLVLGYLTYTKSLLIPVVLVLITLSWFGHGTGTRRLWAGIRSHLVAWISYGAISALFVIGYLMAAPANPRSNWTSLFGLTQRTALETFGTSVVGGPWRWNIFGSGPISYSNAPTELIVLAWLVIAGAVTWAWATRVRNLRALWIPAIYLAASILLVWSGRGYALNLLGPSYVGQHLQYIADSAPAVTLALGALFLPIVGAPDAVAKRDVPLVTFRLPPLLLIGLASAFLVGSVLSSSRFAEPWTQDYLERSFTERAVTNIRSTQPVLADTVVPNEVLNVIFGDRTRLSRYFAALGTDLDVRDAGTDLKVFNLSGNPVPADVDAGPRTNAVSTTPCPIQVTGKVRTIKFPPIVNLPFWMAIDYSANFSGDVVLTVAGKQRSVPIEQGDHRLLVATTGAYDHIQIRPLVEQSICVKSVRIGTLQNPDTQ